jgi:hypothetical protein
MRGCLANQSRNNKEVKMKLPVHIRRNADVDNELVNISKSEGDELVWYSTGDEFTIEFPITPFNDYKFVVPAGGSKGSGPVRADAPLTRYFYDVTNTALAMSADPGVHIRP